MLEKILRLGEGRRVKQLEGRVADVSELEDAVRELDDDELRAKTDEFRTRYEEGAELDDLLPEAFAVVREAAWRVLEQRPFDVQVLGAIALHEGDVAEMKTGEGKTLTSTMPVYLNALSGESVHVVTVNPYLAARDAEWMGRIYTFLGLETGLVFSGQKKADKRRAYACDITYGTNNEFGFDFLRDRMVQRPEQKVQRGHGFAIVDEADSILIDEARTPLIISGPADQHSEWYEVFAKRVAPKLERDRHYEVDEAKRTVSITDEGVSRVEEILGVENLYESVNTPLIHHLNNAVKAKELFRRDQEYVVTDGEVHIVDEFTGRVLTGRRYSEGLHQAIEAKEGVEIKAENQTLASITLQNYFRNYSTLAGMTGTAKTEEGEFAHIYNCGVVQVPTNEPMIRVDQPDFIYKTSEAKFTAAADDIAERHERGQPVLVGTTSIEKSEQISELMAQRGIPHEILNAKNHFKEAEIIAQAGRIGAVTVATNMAGRGVDIMLGGNPEFLADEEARRQLGGGPEDEEIDGDDFQRVYEEQLERFAAETKAEGEKVKELGGLYVLGTERHESRRIDNQLRGRSGRQGDPGESRFYLSLEDDLMRVFNASAVDSIMNRLKLPDDVPIEHKMVSRAVQRAQTQVESVNFERRKTVLKYDDVMNQQRKLIYEQRDEVLEGADERVAEIAWQFIEDAVAGLVTEYAPEKQYPEEWRLEELWNELGRIWDVQVDRGELDLENLEQNQLQRMLVEDARARYAEREEDLGSDLLRKVERRVTLSVVDRMWREHLYEMDQLRDGIGLRAVGQRDPLVEYTREARDAFNAMMERIKLEAAGYFFNLPVEKPEEQQASQASDAEADGNAASSAPDARGEPAADGAGDAATGRESGSGGQGTQRRRGEVRRPALESESASEEDGPDPSQLSYSAPNKGSGSYTVSTSGGRVGTGAGRPGAAVAAQARTQNQRQPAQTTVVKENKIGRNDQCPCGSGRKYKKCHGAA
ncbi:preprotein translocase subunit SecA [Egibacter rhizosphaerae]|uniref:Protein translocase subunit SecA n=1 Tax=Egibacter rhizosphaerae TaxID=1670831 RepID=A0A411YDE8_9ACTN|nr:preprotein translocase subunit SecA [Egibacter rhizosphaerae]QBI19192.1 preprotein translocase subunit SecA [Egibacter rhizosphaerae]